MRPVITLSPGELSHLAKLAEARADKSHSQKVDPGIGESEAHLRGLKAEAVVAKHFGVNIDENIYATGDGGIDLHVHGYTVQVKWNRHARVLYFNSEFDFKTDVAILVYPVTEDQFEITGCISRLKFRRNCVRYDWGYGIRVGVGESFLSPVDCLSQHPRKREIA